MDGKGQPSTHMTLVFSEVKRKPVFGIPPTLHDDEGGTYDPITLKGR